MKGRADSTGATENGGGFVMIPDGEYTVKITEISPGQTKAGDPMMTLTLEVCSMGEFGGRKLWDRIIIPQQGSSAFAIMGRTMHFLHCIGEPYEGQFTWNTDNWQGQFVKVEIGSAKYTDKNGNEKIKNEVKAYLLEEKPASEAAKDDGIPF